MDSGVGYRHVGTVQGYENRRFVGEGRRDAAVDREELLLTTRTVHVDVPPEHGGGPGASGGALDRICVDYVDSIYAHWPAGIYEHQAVLLALTAAVSDGICDQGKRALRRPRSLTSTPGPGQQGITKLILLYVPASNDTFPHTSRRVSASR